MPSAVSFISAAHADNRPPNLGCIVQKTLYQRTAVMGAVGIPKAEIDYHRHLQCNPLPDSVSDSAHNLRCPGKRGGIRHSQFDNQQIRLRRCSMISRAVSCRNPRHRRSVPAGIRTGKQCKLFSVGKRQCLIDLVRIEFHANPISFRGTSACSCRSLSPLIRHIRLQRLIPEISDPRTAVRLPEFRHSVINSAVQNGDQDPCPGEKRISEAHLGNAGIIRGHFGFIKIPFRLLYILYLLQFHYTLHQSFRRRQYGISCNQILYLDIELLQYIQTAMILRNQLP